MDLGLQSKVLVISGGASGIGEAIAREATAEGAIAVLVDRNTTPGLKLESELQQAGHGGMFVEAELTREDDCRRAIAQVLSRYQRIDCLVNNAGINDGVGLEAGTPSDFMQSLWRNLFHYYALAHFALAALKQFRGTIINIGSKTAVTGQGGTSGYCAAKGGQLALTREWAVELVKYGIRVNAVIPAEVMTPMYESWIRKIDNAEEKLREIQKRIPLGNRMTTPREIAQTVLFLASDRASHITGQHIYVDGGYTHLDRALGQLNQ